MDQQFCAALYKPYLLRLLIRYACMIASLLTGPHLFIFDFDLLLCFLGQSQIGLYSIFQTQILIPFLYRETMILKLVYDKEIHVYDLKNEQTFQNVCQKIRQLFIKLPQQFILCYKNSQGEFIVLENNQQFNTLITTIKNDLKVCRLLIKAPNQSRQRKIQIKPEQTAKMPSKQQNNQLSQEFRRFKQTDQDSQMFTDLTKMHQQLYDLDKHCKGSLEGKQQERKYVHQDKTFYALEVPREFSFGNMLDQGGCGSRRKINAGVDLHSDHRQLRKLQNGLNKEGKQSFSESTLSKLQQLQRAQVRPLNLKGTQPKISYKINIQNAQPNEEQNENSRTHNVQCGICNRDPICGSRYTCTLCQNYNLCQKCEDRFSHQHPLLKIRYTYQTPIKMQVQVPKFKNEPFKQIENSIVQQTIDLVCLNIQQRKQRMMSLQKQISQLLQIGRKQCHQFIRQNEKYVKEKLIQMLVVRKFDNSSVRMVQNRISNIPDDRLGLGAFFKIAKRKF